MNKKPTYKELEQRVRELETTVDHCLPAKRKLQESEERLRAFMYHSPSFMYMKDSSGKHLYANRSLLEYFNISLDEFVGTTSHDFLPENVARMIEQYDREVIEKGSPVETDDYSVLLPDRLLHVKEIKFPVKLYSGEVGVGGIVMDITELKRTEQSLRVQLEFERLIAHIASRLTQTEPEQLKDSIDRTLESLGRFLRTERAFLAQFTDDGKSLYHRSMWASEGIDIPSYLFEMDFAAQSPWLAQQIRTGKVINTGPGLVNLPEEAGDLRKGLEEGGINLGVVVPVQAEGRVVGMLGLDTVVHSHEYPEPIVNRLSIVADMIGSLLQRVKTQTILQESLNQVEQLKERLEQENIYLRDQISHPDMHEKIIGRSEAIKYVLFKVEQVGPSDSTVLILGETGTGKGLVARAIHDISPRKDRGMVTVNCAALPANLIESELFGREKGAFTGALNQQIGRFEFADGGTVFLDEIGELPLELQSKLLRVIEDGEFERLGSPKTVKVDVRIIASTNRELSEEIRNGRFREDLYYRLNVFPITIPPLRKRTKDIPILVNHLVSAITRNAGKKISEIPKTVMRELEAYHWPGNVRELQNVIERAVITTHSPVLRLADRLASPPLSRSSIIPKPRLVDMERDHILKSLEESNWKVEGKHGAADSLGLNPSTLRTKMRKLGIKRPRKWN
jgi:PAS domain S-box-containing protein